MNRSLAALLLCVPALCLASGVGHASVTVVTKVKIVVTGSAPKGATVYYGRDEATYPGHFPLRTTMSVDSGMTAYTFVSARLKKGGKITCRLTIGKTTKVGHAKGKHKLCYVRLTNDNKGGWY